MIRRGLRRGFEAFRNVDNAVTPFARKGIYGAGNAAVASGEFAWKMGGKKATSLLWKTAKSPIGITLGLGAGIGAMTYDGSNDFSQHIATEMLATGADDLMAFGAFAVNPLLGVAAVGAMVAGVSPGAFVRDKMESMQKDIARKRYGSAPITQNKRTMQATQRNLSLLGQGGNYSMLGNEASLMHN
jgi:hypothetical protein